MRSGIYKHYKGGYYQVLGVGAHTETEEKMVVYVSLDASHLGPRLRIRPLEGLSGFQTPPTRGVERFVYIGDQIK